MRVLLLDKTAGLDTSHERHQAIASHPDTDLFVLGPRHWIENGRPVHWRPRVDCRYTPVVGSMLFQGYYARAAYIHGLIRAMLRSRPDIIQLLEEPWSFSAAQTMILAGFFAPQARILFYTWENREQGWDYPSRGATLYRPIDKMLHTCSSAAICATPSAESVLRNKGYTRETFVIPYGIPAQYFSTQTRKRSAAPFTIGYIGRLLYMKGVDTLIEALADLPEARLLLVGEGDDESAFRSLAKERNNADRIEWRGSIDEYAIPDTLHEIDTLVLPSRTTPGWKEQLGRVLIEAMAAGVPVIGSDSGAIPDVIGDAGLVFPEGNAAQLTRQIKHLMSNPIEATSLGERGQIRARERFTWERFAHEITAAWQTTLAS